MRLLAYHISFFILAISAEGASAQQLPTGPGQALAVYNSCQGADLDPFRSMAKLNDLGWLNDTKETAFRRTVAENLNIKFRTFLSESSYPDSFEDSRQASPEEASARVRRQAENAVFEMRGSVEGDDPARLVFVLKAPGDEAIAIIDFFRGVDYSHLICETTTHARSNPVLTGLLLSDRKEAGTRGAAFERWRTSGPEVNYAYLLSKHARQEDDRFETQYDMVLRSAFFRRASR